MAWQEIVGWLGTFIALGGYFASVRLERPRVFHIANVIGVWGVAISAIHVGAWPSLFITSSFGAIGAWGLIRGEQ
jgi:hypothetical protein